MLIPDRSVSSAGYLPLRQRREGILAGQKVYMKCKGWVPIKAEDVRCHLNLNLKHQPRAGKSAKAGGKISILNVTKVTGKQPNTVNDTVSWCNFFL